MKKSTLILQFLLILFCFYGCKKNDKPIYLEQQGEPSGTALVITGAAARISHEMALIERLEELGELEDLEFISGTSAGAIMSLNLNRILDPDFPYGWEDLKNIFFNLKQEEIFANEHNDLPIDTRGAWRFFDKLCENNLKIHSLKSDLIYPTCMTSVRFDNKSLARVTNIEGLNTITDDPVEGVMTSTSFPVVFPSIRINKVDYFDGGLIENIPYSAVFEYQLVRKRPFKKIIIVSFQKNRSIEWKTELDLIFLKNTREQIIESVLEASGFSLDAGVEKSFMEELEYIQRTYPEFTSRTVVYSPNVKNPPYFPTFQFDGTFAKKVYELMRNWALDNKPIPLDEFLKERNANTNVIEN